MKPARPLLQFRAGPGAAAHRRRPLRLPGFLALIPFLLLALISPGTMLARDDAGGVTVVLCVEGGLIEMVQAADGTLTDKAPDGGHSVCYWAPHGQQVLDVASADPVAPLFLPVPLTFAGESPEHLRRAEVLAPSARGPPAVV